MSDGRALLKPAKGVSVVRTPARAAITSRSARRRPAHRFFTARLIVSTSAVVVYLAVWQLLVNTHAIDPSLWCGPWKVARSGGHMIADGELWANAKITLGHFLVGYAIAVAVGIPIGFLMGRIAAVREFLDPIVTTGYCTPAVAVLPVLVAWFGVGLTEQAIIVFIEAVIPVILNSMAGVKDVDPLLVRAARSLCAGRADRFRKVLLPASVPSVVTGMRIGISRGILGIIIAELFASGAGIGNLMGTYGQTYDMAPVIFLVLLVAAFVYVLTRLLGVVESRLSSWRVR
jgi:ABC-type nitrate/sulfonate/bicarbonate transport system permease component